MLGEGDNTLIFTGNGTVSVDYRGGSFVMYKVKIGDEYLYHPWDSTRQIADPKLDTELNKNGSFTFSVYFG